MERKNKRKNITRHLMDRVRDEINRTQDILDGVRDGNGNFGDPSDTSVPIPLCSDDIQNLVRETVQRPIDTVLGAVRAASAPQTRGKSASEEPDESA